MKIAVLGLGWWGPKLLRNFASALGPGQVIGADPDPEAVAGLSGKYGAATTTDIEAVLADPSIHGVAIATPPATHYEYTRRALLAGKHVLVEKPPTLEVREFEDVAALSLERGCVYMADFTYIFSPAVRVFKDLIGGAGRAATFVQSLRYGDNLRRDTIDRLKKAMLKNHMNVLEDLIYHDLGILTFLFEAEPFVPENVSTASNIFPELPDVAHVVGRIGRTRVHIGLSWTLPERRREVTVFLPDQIAVWNDLEEQDKVRLFRTQQRREEIVPVPDYHLEPLQGVVEHFLECIRDKRTSRTGVDFMRRVVTAYQRSHELCEAVSLSQLSPR